MPSKFLLTTAAVGLAVAVLPAAAVAKAAPSRAAATAPPVTAQPPAQDGEIARYFSDPANAPVLPRDQMIALLRQRIKYVFVIFNENESFDHEYGTFPGANGLFSTGTQPRDAAATPGFTQTYTDSSTGATGSVSTGRKCTSSKCSDCAASGTSAAPIPARTRASMEWIWLSD